MTTLGSCQTWVGPDTEVLNVSSASPHQVSGPENTMGRWKFGGNVMTPFATCMLDRMSENKHYHSSERKCNPSLFIFIFIYLFLGPGIIIV